MFPILVACIFWPSESECSEHAAKSQVTEGAVMDQEVGRVAEFVSEAIDQSAGDS